MAVLVKTLNGLAYASVKSRDGLAVGSISRINGVDVTSGGGGPWANPYTTGLVLDLCCDDYNSTTGTWTDTSSSNNDATPYGASRPGAGATLNGHVGLGFSGADNEALVLNDQILGARTVFLVIAAESGIADYAHFFGSQISTGDYPWHGGVGSALIYNLASPDSVINGAGWENSSSVSPASMTKGTTAKLYTFETTANVSLETFGWWPELFQAGRAWKGPMYHVVVYSGVLDTADREDVRDALLSFYGL